MFNFDRYNQLAVVDNISDLISHYADAQPEHIALIDGETRLSYRDLDSMVSTFARAMLASGIKIGDRVGVMTQPDRHYLVSLLACARIGAIWVGLHPDYSLSELEYIFEDADPVMIFYHGPINGHDFQAELGHLARLQKVELVQLEPCPAHYVGTSWVNFVARAVNTDEVEIRRYHNSTNPDDPCLLVYTSGTSGDPKGVLVHHAGLVQAGRTQASYWSADPVRIINYLPINHIGGVVDISIYALVAGGTQIMMQHFTPAELNQLLIQHEATVWIGPPESIQACVDDDSFDATHLQHLQWIAWTGQALDSSYLPRLREIGCQLSTAYSLTESVSAICFVEAGASDEVLLNTVGKMVSIYETRLMSETGHLTKFGEIGEIQCRGDFVMRGYHNQPDFSLTMFDEDGWLKTGDLGRMRDDGNIELIGRLKYYFESGGYNVYPRELERLINNFDGVIVSAVVAKPHPLYHQVPVAFIQVDHPVSFSVEKLTDYCRANLPEFEVPRAFMLLDSIPLLPAGEVDKRALQRLVRPHMAGLLE